MSGDEAAPARIALVMPAGVAPTDCGGGRRTQLFYRAAVQVAETDLIVLGETGGTDFDRIFPDARTITFVPFPDFRARSKSRLAVLAREASVALQLQRRYRPDPELTDRLAALMREGGHDAVLWRYTRTFCLCLPEGAQDGGRAHCLDIDDLDETKIATAFDERFGPAFRKRLFEPVFLTPLRRYLQRRMTAADLVWLAADEDHGRLGGVPARVAPNAVEAPGAADVAPASAGRDLLFVGVHGFRPNNEAVAWFLRTCWPLLRARVPEARLRVVGRGDWPGFGRDHAHLGGVDFVGGVDDLAAEYARARAVIAPIRLGAGSKIKVIEACAYARPVIVTPHAARGFGPEIAAGLDIAETPGAFAEAAARYLCDPAAAEVAGSRLRKLQQAKFSERAVIAGIADDIRAAWRQKRIAGPGDGTAP